MFNSSIEPTQFAELAVFLADDSPIDVPPYRIKPLEPLRSVNIFAAPVVLVFKKDGGIRLTVDYRKLLSRLEEYPLPRKM